MCIPTQSCKSGRAFWFRLGFDLNIDKLLGLILAWYVPNVSGRYKNIPVIEITSQHWIKILLRYQYIIIISLLSC